MNFKIDNLQYCKWDRSVFEINRDAGLDAVHVTIVYHEDFDELQKRILEWEEHFKNHDVSFTVVPVFQVVRFPNDICIVSGGAKNGTCYTA